MKLEFHPIADIFPAMSEVEYHDLVEDMRLHGQLEPIWVDKKGLVIDGRHRTEACIELGIPVESRTYQGEDASIPAFVVSMNLKRRHLDESQRAMVAAAFGEISPMTQEQLSQLFNIDRKSTYYARKVKRKGTSELQEAVKDGEVSVSAAALIAELPEKEQVKIVERGHTEIVKKSKAIRQKKQKKRRKKRLDILKSTAEASQLEGSTIGRFPIIYADPPWEYEHVETESRAIENKYPTMSLDEIRALPVSDIATDDCVLFLWATSPKVAEAISVIEAWGFEYRTCMAWVKDKIGMGYFVRQQHEHLLIAKKGNPPMPEPSNRPPSVITAPRRKHSAKPAAFAEAIETMYPTLPKIELFARSARQGWAVWGNEVIAA